MRHLCWQGTTSGVPPQPASTGEVAGPPGAINIPGNQLRKKAPERIPDKDRGIVVYCANPSCEASPRAAKLLMDMGYTNVKDYAGGKEHWREGGLPVESGTPQPA